MNLIVGAIKCTKSAIIVINKRKCRKLIIKKEIDVLISLIEIV
jgi:hypothetical protein